MARERSSSDLVERFGADRLAWGSDHPQSYELPYPEMVAARAEGRGAGLQPNARTAVLGGTARRLWFGERLMGACGWGSTGRRSSTPRPRWPTSRGPTASRSPRSRRTSVCAASPLYAHVDGLDGLRRDLAVHGQQELARRSGPR